MSYIGAMWRSENWREEAPALLRLAGRLERPVEVVEQSDALMSRGGVGCLLRYKTDLLKQDSKHSDTVSVTAPHSDVSRTDAGDPSLPQELPRAV